MEVKLIAKEDVTFQIGYKLKHIKKGGILEAKFSESGVSLKLEGVWSLDFSYKEIEEKLKTYNEDCISNERHLMVVKNTIKRYKSRLSDSDKKHIEAHLKLEEIRELTKQTVNGYWAPEVIYINEVDKILERYFGEKSY